MSIPPVSNTLAQQPLQASTQTNAVRKASLKRIRAEHKRESEILRRSQMSQYYAQINADLDRLSEDGLVTKKPKRTQNDILKHSAEILSKISSSNAPKDSTLVNTSSVDLLRTTLNDANSSPSKIVENASTTIDSLQGKVSQLQQEKENLRLPFQTLISFLGYQGNTSGLTDAKIVQQASHALQIQNQMINTLRFQLQAKEQENQLLRQQGVFDSSFLL